MRVLVVCSGNFPDPEKNFSINQAFIHDQLSALNKYQNVEFDIFLIKGKGIWGYLSNIRKVGRKIRNGNYDLVHAHFCLSGLISVIASHIPVVVTFHGSDINNRLLNVISSITSLLAGHAIFVSDRMFRKVHVKAKRSSVIPCGVDFGLFYPESKEECMKIERMDSRFRYVLFSSAFNIRVKNVMLAQQAISLTGSSVRLIELKNRSRDQVRTLINACDAVLMTSFTEGSPQIIKEAMACNCPIVSTDVGDVQDVIGNTAGCFICSYEPADLADKLRQALAFGKRTTGRERIGHLDNRIIAGKVYNFYLEVLNGKV